MPGDQQGRNKALSLPLDREQTQATVATIEGTQMLGGAAAGVGAQGEIETRRLSKGLV